MEMTARSLPTLVKQSERGVEHDMLLLLTMLIKYIHKKSKVGCVLTPHAASGKQGGKGKSRLQPWREMSRVQC
jgi:hypothetical protein